MLECAVKGMSLQIPTFVANSMTDRRTDRRTHSRTP